MTLDTGPFVRFWAHQQLVREAFAECKLLNGEQFDAVTWEAVYNKLHLVPQMYQLWACNQVWSMAGTNYSHAE